MKERITNGPGSDGVDRRGFLKCMAWAGTGVVWAVSGGMLGCSRVEQEADQAAAPTFTFVQVSDSHLGFSSDPNRDVAETYRVAIAKINNLPTRPAFVLHTGDLTHMAKVEEFAAVDQLHSTIQADQVFCVPGEHDLEGPDPRRFMERYGQGAVTGGLGWRSFDYRGVHFVGLNNCMALHVGSLGLLGAAQLGWLRDDLAGKSDSTPIVVFAHIPLWTVYPQWNWGTQDSAQVMELLARFGSVTVLNGHIHQILQKVEGHVTFHSARSTAFPQPVAGQAPSPGPIRNLPAGQLRNMLGVTRVAYVEHNSTLAITDETLA
jgi:3',5'-cyclic AMP phosphodiesterase CpdA